MKKLNLRGGFDPIENRGIASDTLTQISGLNKSVSNTSADLSSDFQLTNNLTDSRKKLFEYLSSKGNILTNDHFVAKYFNNLIHNFDMPEQLDLVFVDTEDFLCFYEIDSKVIVMSSGVIKNLNLNLGEVKVDHIIGLLSHEIEHSNNKKFEQATQKTKQFGRVDQAEEYRSDRGAVYRSAYMGYNPTAFIEVLKSFGLKSGRGGTSHPESIDRISRLGKIQVDDENPLPNCDKSYTSIPNDIMNWLNKPSKIYEQTENLLQSSLDQVGLDLEKSKTISEFIRLLSYKKHISVLGKAKVLDDSQEIDKLFFNLMILKSLRNIYLYNVPDTGNIFDKFMNYYRLELLENDYGTHNHSSAYEDNSDFNKIFKSIGIIEGRSFLDVLGAEEFRDEVKDGRLDEVKEIESNLSLLNAEYEFKINNILEFIQKLDLLEDEGVPKELKDFIKKIQNSFDRKNIDSQLFEEVFHYVNINFAENKKQKKDEERSELGLRKGVELNKNNYYDVEELSNQKRFEKNIKLDMAVHFIGSVTADETEISILTKILQVQYNFDLQTSNKLANLILLHSDIKIWQEYLKTLGKDKLVDILENLQKLEPLMGLFKLSPIREFHESFGNSLNSIQYNIGRDSDIRYSNKLYYDGINTILVETADELFSRGFEKGVHDFEVNSSYISLESFESLNLTPKEWTKLYEINRYKDIVIDLAVKDLVKSNGKVDNMSKFFKKILLGVNHISKDSRLRAKELLVLLRSSICDKKNKLELIQGRLSIIHYNYFLCDTDRNSKECQDGELEELFIYAYQLQDIRSEKAILVEKILYLMKDKYKGDVEIPFNTIKKNDIKIDVLNMKTCSFGFFGLFTPKMLNELSEIHKNEFEGISSDIFRILGFIEDDAKRKSIGAILNGSDLISYFFLNHIKSEFGIEQSIEIIESCIHNKKLQDIYLIGFWEILEGDEKDKYMLIINNKIGTSSDRMDSRDSSFFDPVLYKGAKKLFFSFIDNQKFLEGSVKKLVRNYDRYSSDEKRQAVSQFKRYLHEKYMRPIIGEGMIANQFPDLLRRKHNFFQLSNEYCQEKDVGKEYRLSEVYISKSLDQLYGSGSQKFESKLLAQKEDEIFSHESTENKISTLNKYSRFPSIIRDIYLDIIFQQEIETKLDNKRIVELGELICPLFSKDSDLRLMYGNLVLEAMSRLDNNLLNNYQKGLELIDFFFGDKPSLAKNHYLNELEIACNLNNEEIVNIIGLRMSPEMQEISEENSLIMSFYGQLGEMNREERSTYLKRLLNISKERPKSIIRFQDEMDGHLDNLPKLFASLTPLEQEQIIFRICTGDEGLMELSTVSEKYSQECYNIKEEFIKSLADKLLKNCSPKEKKLFKKIFVNIFMRSKSRRSTQILSNIIVEFIKVTKENENMQPSELVALMLDQGGVVGKKVAQSLAGLPWLKEKYPKYYESLKGSQSSSNNYLFKRSMYLQALADGLIDGTKGLKIISFDEILSSASNKQACMLTVEVLDEKKYGLKAGQYKLVGKFKRPSAQKDNVGDDIELANIVLDTIQKDIKGSVSKSLLLGVEYSLTKELDFQKEKEFTDQLKGDMQKAKQNKSNTVGLSDIIYAGDDIVLEILAEGISFREYLDCLEEGTLDKDYQQLDKKQLLKAVFIEALSQYIIYGKVHGDLHPGNFFVNKDGKITLIDKGMHEILDKNSKNNVLFLLSSLVMGNKIGIRKVLKNLGWNIRNTKFEFKPFSFEYNINELLEKSNKAKNIDPFVISIIFSISKLGEFVNELGVKDILWCLKEVRKKSL